MNKKIIKLLTIFFALSIFIPFLTNIVIAQDQETTPTAEVTNNDEKVQGIREEVQKKVQDILEENKLGDKKGYSGPIISIEDLTLTLETNEGAKEVEVATDAAIIGQSGKDIKAEDLKKNLFVVAMGYINEQAQLEVSRLVVQEKPKSSDKEVIRGKITDISTEEQILTVKNEKENLIFTIEIDKDTDLSRRDENGKKSKSKFSNLEKNDRIFVIGEPTENEHKIITASIVLSIAGVQEKETSTPTSTTTPATE